VGERYGRLLVLERKGTTQKLTNWVCECDCGNVVEKTSTKLRHGGCRSCGCLRRETNAGPNSRWWNPDLSEEQRELNKQSWIPREQTKWAKKVKKRDGFICQICNEHTTSLTCKLNAHHLYSKATYPEMALLVDNGVTLCETCHKTFHMCYGWYKTPVTSCDFDNHVNTLNQLERMR